MKSVMVSMPTNCWRAESHSGAALTPLYTSAKNACRREISVSDLKEGRGRERRGEEEMRGDVI